MSDGKRCLAVGWLAAVVMLGAVASPARADEPGGCPDRTVSVAGRFLTTNGWNKKECRTEFNLVGNLVVWGLIATSCVAVGLIINSSLKARHTEMVPHQTVATLERLLAERKYGEAKDLVANDPSLFGRIMKAAFNQATHGFNAMQDAINENGSYLSSAQIRAIEILNVLGAVGPMAGLFGTVYGMIESFFKIANAGGSPSPGELATGISTALVCTFWGLIVAVPSIIAYGMIRSKIEGNTDEAMTKAVELISVFRPGRRPVGAPGPGPVPVMMPGAMPSASPNAIPGGPGIPSPAPGAMPPLPPGAIPPPRPAGGSVPSHPATA